MLCLVGMMALKWVVIPFMLSMRENWLLVGGACAKFGYLVTHWTSMREISLLNG
jgi:hypothetical protein